MHGEGILEDTGRKGRSLSLDNVGGGDGLLAEEKELSRSQGSRTTSNSPEGGQQIGSTIDRSPDAGPKSRPREYGGSPSDMDLMKEKFAKLLLGEDMSGGGTGVASALALSNAITNLAGCLISTSILTIQEYLDNFKDQKEFWYVSRDAAESEKGNAKRTDDKWWLPTVRVPANGLSETSRKWIQHQKELVTQVLKAAMAINANVIMEMDIPEDYMETLPKNGRSSLGEALYKNITDGDFDAEAFLETLDLSTEHKILDLKNRIEASVVIWRRKMSNKDVKSSWVSGVSGISWEKREIFEDRAETILLILKHRFPGIPQSALDISKIQYNKDVGYSILESYSRILESLAFTVISRIEDVQREDALAQNPSDGDLKRNLSMTDSEPVTGTANPVDPGEENDTLDKVEVNNSMTLSDFMDWQLDQDSQSKEEDSSNLDKTVNSEDGKLTRKPPNGVVNKKFSYIEKLVSWEA